MSDKFEQWVKDNEFFATTPISGGYVVHSGAVVSEWNAALSSLQGEAVGEAFNGRCFLYDAHPVKNLHIENGAKLFTYPPDASAKIARLEAENATLYTTMMAAAVKIQEHWEAHCDDEGYGPSNLIHRLESGIASRYGYDAETVVVMEAKIAEQEARIKELESELAEQARLLGISAERELALQAKLAEVEKDAKRYRWLRSGGKDLGGEVIIYGYSPQGLDDSIDAAIQESKKGIV